MILFLVRFLPNPVRLVAGGTMYHSNVYVGGYGRSRQTNYAGSQYTEPYTNPYYRHQRHQQPSRYGQRQHGQQRRRHQQPATDLYGYSSPYTSGSSYQAGRGTHPSYKTNPVRLLLLNKFHHPILIYYKEVKSR